MKVRKYEENMKKIKWKKNEKRIDIMINIWYYNIREKRKQKTLTKKEIELWLK